VSQRDVYIYEAIGVVVVVVFMICVIWSANQ